MDFNRKPKRKARSVQDMVGVGMDISRPTHRSNYQGPYKRSNEINDLSPQRSRSAAPARQRSSYVPPVQTGGFQNIAWIIFSGVLVICIAVTMILYFTSAKKSSYTYPLDVVTMTGVLTDIYEEQALIDSSMTGDASAASAQTTAGDMAGTDMAAQDEATDTTATGDTATGDTTSAQSSTVTGAAMVLDSGAGMTGYSSAASYTELLSQLEGALASGDSAFVGSKLGYTDETSGAVTGYPQSVVENFVSYMAGNADKRTAFIQSINDEAKYSAMNGTAYIVKLPVIHYTVKTDYDNTTFSLTGFSEQTISKNQSAVVSPILPCMYTLTVSNPVWSQPLTQEMEAKFGENLELNFGANQ